ncbi:phosphonate metabolism transcriptional regulator PhnF [Siccirubricoccus sp. KC 17139]|uniref:Phosphonate metabolism transcriptional regulator PhnF n=1 Tax=Siccirubricoccus soli TaxID=2899147 RepID=A0ABT1D8W3_9PROT|nr:phosphonate metabolism transcriptional regulator PhnF [Siccirubricoccus soli]MCO6417420.1 phosphonate metabolism transcriptional regulator PhnF [Siccirubricoccus soli]MCP2683555.1 phosphonate metabolism transcriptional regulator PhnF [Siccirubricoccus soli]
MTKPSTKPGPQAGPGPLASPPALARGQGVALWRQIAGTLESEIAGGSLEPGTRLPTEAELTARFGVNRHTVRRAMEELESRGLVRVEQGRGSFVAEDVLDYPLGPRTRFSETIRRQNREPQGRILRIEETVADSTIAELLKLRRGKPVVVAERLGLVDGRPVVVGAHWFSVERFPRIAALLAEDASVTKALSQLGVPEYRRLVTRITARMPTPEEAVLLEQARSRPVLVTESVNVDGAGAPVEASIARYAAGRMQIVVES